MVTRRANRRATSHLYSTYDRPGAGKKSAMGTPGTSPNSAEQTLMGETIAHEAGHWLGLFHLVENGYHTTATIYTRDAISETPRCTGNPTNLANCDSTAETSAGARNVAKNPTRVSAVLRQAESKSVGYVRQAAARILSNIRAGAKSPAGKDVQSPNQRTNR